MDDVLITREVGKWKSIPLCEEKFMERLTLPDRDIISRRLNLHGIHYRCIAESVSGLLVIINILLIFLAYFQIFFLYFEV